SLAEKRAPPRNPCNSLLAAAGLQQLSDKSDPSCASHTPREIRDTRLPANKIPCDRRTDPPFASRLGLRSLREQSPRSPALRDHSSRTEPFLPARAAKIPRTSFHLGPAES